MKTIIHEIRQQPHHVRELATLLCTVVVVSAIGLVWFRSFQNNIYALLNPEDASQAEERIFAKESRSLFGSISDTLANSRAQISDFFKGKSGEVEVTNGGAYQENTTTHPLPVSGNK